MQKKLISTGHLGHKSFSQCGEDLIIHFICNHMGLTRPSYLDLGAHHPSYLNNTNIFYRSGSRGINVEADPTLINKFYNARRQDINLNVGVAPEGSSEELDFYLMTQPTMNTFSGVEAHRIDSETKIKIKKIIKLPVRTVEDILGEYWSAKFPDILSVDIEGLDAIVINSLLGFSIEARPSVICIETIEYAENTIPSKKSEMIEFIKSLGYFLYADTWINSIFVREDKFKKSYQKD